ncbi:hypothetical protein B0H10DRAFT_600850 [Mycena sp. CBHHK59/15]|nr:hypothetical protein B0H10DRAFT_116239 [Mycena sp. CBHHK59/15]KAJ6605807.1 hypothetical protein B0H10DRAFT_600850 [Mycena sp. CBHHK59/15]
MSSPSATSLVSNTTISSHAPLRGSTPAPKDFEAAFATLQSTYGFNGLAPSPVLKSQTAQNVQPDASTASTTTLSSSARSRAQPKDYEAAFATLQSTYGFSGHAPSPVTKPKNSPSTFTLGALFTKLKRTPSDVTTPSKSLKSTPSNYKVKVRHLPPPSAQSIVL